MLPEKENYFEKAIAWVKSRGLRGIKANHDDFETPAQFTRTDADQPFVPDITAKQKARKYYVEIAVKNDQKRRTVSKWKLLSTLAHMKGGKFYLLAPRGHKAFAERMLEKYHLPNAQLVYLG